MSKGVEKRIIATDLKEPSLSVDVCYHHKRGLRSDLRKTNRYIHGRKERGGI